MNHVGSNESVSTFGWAFWASLFARQSSSILGIYEEHMGNELRPRWTF